MNWIRIFNPDVLAASNFIKAVTVKGKRLCIVKIEDEIFATQARCPHAGGDLSQGWCKNRKLICPYHRYEYDLLTGKGAEGQGDYINIYPVEIRDDGVYVGFKERNMFFKKLFRL